MPRRLVTVSDIEATGQTAVITACGAGVERVILEFFDGPGGFAVDGREYMTIWHSARHMPRETGCTDTE